MQRLIMIMMLLMLLLMLMLMILMIIIRSVQFRLLNLKFDLNEQTALQWFSGKCALFKLFVLVKKPLD